MDLGLSGRAVVIPTDVTQWDAVQAMVAAAKAEFGTVDVLPTDVYAQWDGDLLVELSAEWAARGYTHDNGPGAMDVDEAASAVVAAITSPIDLRYVLAWPAPGSTMGDAQ
jgi:NAD(P)-dependent dehydrogenase (short-subunit alcohol dehydrogenase family)